MKVNWLQDATLSIFHMVVKSEVKKKNNNSRTRLCSKWFPRHISYAGCGSFRRPWSELTSLFTPTTEAMFIQVQSKTPPWFANTQRECALQPGQLQRQQLSGDVTTQRSSLSPAVLTNVAPQLIPEHTTLHACVYVCVREGERECVWDTFLSLLKDSWDPIFRRFLQWIATVISLNLAVCIRRAADAFHYILFLHPLLWKQDLCVS